MKRKLLHAVLATAMSLPVLCAQTTSTTTSTPPTPAQIAANMVARLTTLLDLTTSQQNSATTAFTLEQSTLASLATQVQTQQTALQTAVLANKGADIKTAAAALGSLNGQQVLADATADATFYALLTTDQQTKYTSLKLYDLGGGPGLPGGPGAGGPPPGGRGGPGK